MVSRLRIWKEIDVAYFMVLSQHLAARDYQKLKTSVRKLVIQPRFESGIT
jgi:hypothetical protein